MYIYYVIWKIHSKLLSKAEFVYDGNMSNAERFKLMAINCRNFRNLILNQNDFLTVNTV